MIEIPAEVVRQEVEKVTNQFRRVARIPGFRPGHARPALVRQHFRNDIRNEVVQSLVPKFFSSVVKEQNLSVVGHPHFEDLKFEDDQPLTCRATFEILPEFELGEYKGLEMEEEPDTVGDADVDQALDELRERAATFEVVADRPAADDDYVYVSYQGRDVNDNSKAPIEARDAVVHVGGKGTVTAFTENLRGAKPGEAREFEVPYPEDFTQKSLAGKTIRYRVEVQSIKQKVVPPLDDELAKSVSESETLADLRTEVRTGLEKARKRQVENAAMKKLLEQLQARHDFVAPEALVEAQLDRKLERIVAQVMAQGIDPRTTEIDWRKIREESRPEAEKDVRGSLILSRISEAEGIEVSDEEVDEMVRDLAAERRETPAALKTRLTREGGLDTIKSARRNQKALELIYRNAKIIRKSE
ncbi:MAG: trigger factor [Acidobacteria bacterium]|nr:trigger factor [Acidobacteriota bacterium]